MVKFVPFILAIISFTHLIVYEAQGAKLKKISVMSSNDMPYFLRPIDKLIAPFDRPYLLKLRKYVESKGFKLKGKDELEIVTNALDWVARQWKHDGLNQPPKSFRALEILKKVHNENEQYRCVEYGIVLSEVLQAYGFNTRPLALRAPDVAYGGFGKGHVAMEVFLNDLNKWIFLDPQFGVYLTKENIPLNYYELYLEKKSSELNQVKLNFKIELKSPEKDKNDYLTFLKNYFGHITVGGGNQDFAIGLKLENQSQTLTFQGLPTTPVIYVDSEKDFYPSLNRASAILDFKNKVKNFQKLASKYNIKSNDDFLKNMSKFAPSPVFNVSFQSNMKQFSFIEVRSSQKQKWTKVKSDNFTWVADKNLNRLEYRAVNIFDRPGPVSFIELEYK